MKDFGGEYEHGLPLPEEVVWEMWKERVGKEGLEYGFTSNTKGQDTAEIESEELKMPLKLRADVAEFIPKSDAAEVEVNGKNGQEIALDTNLKNGHVETVPRLAGLEQQISGNGIIVTETNGASLEPLEQETQNGEYVGYYHPENSHLRQGSEGRVLGLGEENVFQASVKTEVDPVEPHFPNTITDQASVEPSSKPPIWWLGGKDYWNILYQREQELRTHLYTNNAPPNQVESQYLTLLEECRLYAAAIGLLNRATRGPWKWQGFLRETKSKIWWRSPKHPELSELDVAYLKDFERVVDKELELVAQEVARRERESPGGKNLKGKGTWRKW